MLRILLHYSCKLHNHVILSAHPQATPSINWGAWLSRPATRTSIVNLAVSTTQFEILKSHLKSVEILKSHLKSWNPIEIPLKLLKSLQKSWNPVWNHEILKSHTLFWALQTPRWGHNGLCALDHTRKYLYLRVMHLSKSCPSYPLLGIDRGLDRG